MSDRKKITILFFTGVGGYLLGLFILDLLIDNTTDVLRFLSGTISALVILGLLYIFLKKKNPKVINDIHVEQKDERERMIRHKAGYYTLYFVLTTLFLLFIISIFIYKPIITAIASITFLVTTVIHISLIYYFKKRI